MKKLLLLLTVVFLLSSDTAPKCYKVTKVTTLVEAPEMKKERILFGIKQMTEEMLSEKVSICEDGTPVEVEIMSIEAPSTSTSFGPFAKEKKETLPKKRLRRKGRMQWGRVSR